MKNQHIFALGLVLVFLFALTFGLGFGTHWILTDNGRLVHLPWTLPMGPANSSEDERDVFALFWEVWEILKDDFYGDLPEGSDVPYAAVRGVLATIEDPYTILVEPSPRELEKDALRGSFGGIGAWVAQREDGAIVLTPMDGRPAAEAGVLQGDIVVAVDGTDTQGLLRDDVVALIRGPIGSSVRLTVLREESGETLEIDVRRERIETPTAEWYMLEEPGVGYLRISLLGERTPKEVTEGLDELIDQGAAKLVLDLRSNPGGILDAAVQVSSEFLDRGTVLLERRSDGSERTYEATPGGAGIDLPMVVLVNGGSASGAEIIAGALRANSRASLVGERTFGKGSVQNVYDLSDSSSLHVTVAKWFAPDRQPIDGSGLDPDHEVAFTESDHAQGKDPQLEQAIEILMGRGSEVRLPSAK
jgi:carboxyl-terminal processing protease